MPDPEELQRRKAKAEAAIKIRNREITTQAELDAFMESRGIRPKTPSMVPKSDATNIRSGDQVNRAERAQSSFGDDVMGLVGNVAKGGPLGTFLDEAAALQVGLLTNPRNPMQDFERNRAHMDAPAKEFERRNPGTAMVAQVGGGLVTSGAAVGVGRQVVNRLLGPAASAASRTAATVLPPALTVGQRASNAALNTAAAGAEAAVSGAGEGAGGLRPRIAGAQQAGRMGGILGGAAGTAGATAGALGSTRAGQAVQNMVPRPAGAGSNRIGRGIRATGVRSHDELADADLMVAMERTPLTPEEAVARGLPPDQPAAGLTLEELGRRAARSPQATVYDLLGTPGVRMTRGARTHPDGGAIIDPVLEARREARPDQVRAAVEGAYGQPRENAVLASRRLRTEQQARARPLYEEAYAHGVIQDRELRGMLHDFYQTDPQTFRRVFEAADAAARWSPDGGGPLVNPIRSVELPNGQTAETFGDIDVRTLDHLKKGLDAIEARRGADGAAVLDREVAAGIRARLRPILARADEVIVTPGGRHIYRDARQTWGGDMEARTAFDEGREFTRKSADDVEAEYPALAPQAQEQYRRGNLADVTQVAEKKTDAVDLTTMFRTPDMQRKLGVVIQDQGALGRLQDTIDELYRQRTNDMTIGSGSQSIDKAQDAMDVGALGQAVAAGASPSGFVNWIAQSSLGHRAAGRAEDRVTALSRMLTGRGIDITPTMRRLLETAAREEARRAGRGSFTRGAARAAGNEASEP